MQDHVNDVIMIDDGRNGRPIDLASGRRAFLRSMGLGAAAAAALGAVGATPVSAAHTASDADVLNFALNLEYLEAEFYMRAVDGMGLKATDTFGAGTRGPVVGGHKVDFASKVTAEYAREIAEDEVAHVKFLRKGLGDAKVARPSIDFRNAFTAAARAAGLIGPNQGFDAFGSETNFLLAAFVFEDVGVSAYRYAARLLNDKDFLSAAAGILAVEAYHAGTVRTLLLERGLAAPAQALSDLRDSVDGPADIDQGIIEFNRVNVTPTDRNGIAIARNPGQVINIVTLGGQGKGGFFPNGLNGAVA